MNIFMVILYFFRPFRYGKNDLSRSRGILSPGAPIVSMVGHHGSGSFFIKNLWSIDVVVLSPNPPIRVVVLYLEWQLFEKFVCDKLLIKNNYIYQFSEDYVIPASYLTSFPKLAEFANVEVPKLSYQNSLLYEYYLPPKLTKKIRKFPTNISGISIENIINSMIGAKECDNSDFLNANNRKLKIVGKLPSEYEEIPVVKREDGTLKSLDPQYEEYIRAVNETSNVT